MRKKAIFGLVIVIIGLNLLFNVLSISTGSLVAPLIFVVLGFFFYQKSHRFLSVFFFILSVGVFFDRIFGLNFFGLLLAGVIIYYGIHLVKGRQRTEEYNESFKENTKREEKESYVRPQDASEEFNPSSFQANQAMEEYAGKREFDDSAYRHSWIGDVHYIGEPFELRDVTIWNGIGEVRFDLTKAIIPEGETVIVVQGLIGSIDFYVPEDLALSIQATSLIGDVSLFHEKHSGLNKKLSVKSLDYKQAPRKVRLVLMTAIGEVKVKEV